MAAKSRIVSMSIEDDLLARFDAWAAAKSYPSRSRAFAALAREKLDALAIGEGRGPVVATVTYVYDHHRRELMERIAHLQHEHLDEVVATTHVHLDHARCLEVLILRGAAERVRALAERIVATRGVERGEIAMTSAGGGGEGGHGHGHGGPGWHAAAHAREADGAGAAAGAKGSKRRPPRAKRAR